MSLKFLVLFALAALCLSLNLRQTHEVNAFSKAGAAVDNGVNSVKNAGKTAGAAVAGGAAAAKNKVDQKTDSAKNKVDQSIAEAGNDARQRQA